MRLGFALFSTICIASTAVYGVPPGAPSGVRKVIAEHGMLEPDGKNVVLWHDYGAFGLYRVSDNAALTIAATEGGRALKANVPDTILFDARSFNPLQDVLMPPASLTVSQATGNSLQLIQFVGPIKDSWLDAVRAAGCRPVQYIANNAYLVWAGDTGRQALARLVQEGDFLQYSALHQTQFKLGATVSGRILDATASTEVVKVTIQMLRHEDQAATEQFIQDRTVTEFSPWTPILDFQNALVTVSASSLASIAQRPDVCWIGEWFDRELFDEVQGQIIAANFDATQSGPSGTGYLTTLNSIGFPTDPGVYPLVDIVDDGIGTGSVNSGDPTLHETGNSVNPTRLAFVDNCTSASNGGGPDGHGHINASIVGGYDTRAGFPFQDPDGFQRGLGINPHARLSGTRIFAPGFNLSACGGTDTGLILSQQNQGVQISSNSWGCGGCAGTYDSSSQAFDVGVRDADLSEPGNQAMILIFAAGNDGPGSSTIGSPGNGKNMITVGASESDRSTWTDGCGIGPSGADDAMDVISFSSRGPAPGGRVKPEVIAPGTHIQGTASTHASYNGSGVCDAFEPGGQSVFASSSGTSHSTPAIAGLSSLYYYWLETTYGLTPSPAMMKSYLIAHPTYLTGVSANDTLPSNRQGYGMPDLSVGVDNTARFLLDQAVLFGQSGETWMFSGGVSDPTKPVRIVMAYTDAPGAIGTSPQVNNLNLQAVIGGNTYRGNVFVGQWSTTGGAADTANNYEAIFLPPGTTGNIDITVTAFNIAGDGVPNTGDSTDQDFALVCYNCAQTPDFTVGATPDILDVCIPNGAVYTVDVGQVFGFTDPVTLSTTGQPAGSIVSFSTNPVIPPGLSTLTIATGASSPGSFSIAIDGVGSSGTHTANVTLSLASAAPAAVTLLSPANSATGVELSPVFSWSAAAQAVSYDIQIATDSGFVSIVESGSGLSTTNFTATNPLAEVTQYFWRVRANNDCGSSLWTTGSFTTFEIVCTQFASADVPKSISSSGTPTVTSMVTVSGSGTIADLNILNLNGTHTWISDLDFNLQSPLGTLVQVMAQSCSNEDNFNVNLDDGGIGPPPAWPCPPVGGGTYQPSNALSAFDSEDANGVWTLTVNDNANQDGGSLNGWTVEVCASTTPACILDTDCDDANVCTTDTCVTGVCQNTNNSASCDDGDACTTSDTCSGGLCVGGVPPNCDDSNVCTDDSCNSLTGCVNTNNTVLCDDSDACTTADTCSGGLCVGGAPPNCDDVNVCTDDSCNSLTGCVNTNNSVSCEDGDFCNGAEICSGGICTVGSDPCAPLTCDEVNNLCIPASRIAAIELFYAGRFGDSPDPTYEFMAAGSSATVNNISNYAHGVTGIRVYFDSLMTFATTPSAAFSFGWTTGTGTVFTPVTDTATAITTTAAPQAGATVVTIVIVDDHVRTRWLSITIDAAQITANGMSLDGEITGNPILMPSGDNLPGGDGVFFIGNLAGDVDFERSTLLADTGIIRTQVNPFLLVPITNVYDIDKDERILLTDVGEARLAVNPFLILPLIAP